jgi:UDP-2,3-diacylglucosamine pyrophosphatase LpxH
MLVVISDLHLNDGSAAPENISAKAFAIWMADVLALARQNKARELVFLYLGDMVDLLRTEYWFYPKPGDALGGQERESFPLEHRPWGDRDINQRPDELSPICRTRALEILRRIRQEAYEQLAYLRGDADGIKADLAALGIPISRLYIPGNHDRLFWVEPTVRQEILQALGATTVPGPRPFEVTMPGYDLIARHGHEWDPWNYEAFQKDRLPAELKADDYKLAPIGDPITTEMLARLPFLVTASLPPEISQQVRDQVYEQLRHIEDVRPLSKALHWVLVEPASVAAGYDQATQDAIVGAMNKAIKQIVGDFMNIPFVKAWLAKHDKWNLKPDEADKLQDIRRLSKVLNVKKLDKALKWAEKLGLTKEEDDSIPAIKEVGDAPLARFCVYGHTHTFRHVPMGRSRSRDDLVYLNSGTWRPRVSQAKDQTSFAGYKEMTYLVFYRADEDLGTRSSKSVSYELWNGMMKK